MNPSDFYLKEFSVPQKMSPEYEGKIKAITHAYDSKLRKEIEAENGRIKHERIPEDILNGTNR